MPRKSRPARRRSKRSARGSRRRAARRYRGALHTFQSIHDSLSERYAETPYVRERVLDAEQERKDTKKIIAKWKRKLPVLLPDAASVMHQAITQIEGDAGKFQALKDTTEFQQGLHLLEQLGSDFPNVSMQSSDAQPNLWLLAGEMARETKQEHAMCAADLFDRIGKHAHGW